MKTIKYIAFKHDLTDWQIILNPNFQIKFIKGENFIPDYLTREICRVHETMAPKKNTQAPNNPNPVKLLFPIKCFGVNKLNLKKKQDFILLTLCPTKWWPCTMILRIHLIQSRLPNTQYFKVSDL